jgi:hypothetical protein
MNIKFVQDNSFEDAITEFDAITRCLAKKFKMQLEVAKQGNDTETAVKEHIKLEMLKLARGLFTGCVARNTELSVDWNWRDL